MGFLGSLHCAVMCGPIVLGLPLENRLSSFAISQVLSYQIGRILVYTVLGLLVGLLGSSITLFAKQEVFSLAIGSLLIVVALIQLSGQYVRFFQNSQSWLIKPISKLMGKVYKLPFWGFIAGMLNGLIPCGMVYLALASSLNAGSFRDGAVFMLLFGLGTSPMMIFVSLSGIYLRKYFRFNTQKLIPWFAIFIGALFILRSSNLNIPFLSPIIQSQYGTAEQCG
jgi:hypothetical protein